MKRKVGLVRKVAGALMALLTLWMVFSPTSRALRALPATYRLAVGQRFEVHMGAAVLSSQDEQLVSSAHNTLSARETGETEVTANLFGLFPLGRVRVNVDQELRLIPGGQAVGVALATKGVLVIGVSDVAGQSPAQAAGLKPGDVIEDIDGQEVKNSEHLSALVASAEGKSLRITYRREGAARTTQLTPLQDAASGLWRMGAWVRDSTAGVGTLSYYNPADKTYGALGHAINDGDTGKLLPVKLGSLLQADIVDVRRGQKGTPGELRGSFLRQQVVLGSIESNTPLGIYGSMEKAPESSLYPQGLPVGYRETVKVGPAQILSTIDGQGVKAYDVQITHVARQATPAQKSMVIKVTDPELLEKTGGIVQGMSGSPILQNGRIIGAVTHVFVDDPTQGYGLYIEWMLATAQTVDDAA